MRIIELVREAVDPTSPEFRRWFGQSKVVDERGKPQLMYHGTSHPQEFTEIRALRHFGTLQAAHQFVGGTGDCELLSN